MTAKEFLRQYSDCERLIQFKERHIADLHEQETDISQSYSERVQSSGGGDKQAKIVESRIDLEREVEQLLAVQNRVKKAIYELEDIRQRSVMDACYLRDMNLKKVSEELNFSYDYVRHVHVKALESIKIAHYDT